MVKRTKATKRSRRVKRDPVGDYRSIKKRIVPVKSLEPEMNIVLYGSAGTGKTTLASTFPSPILFVDCSEKGTDSIRDVKNVDVMRAEDFDELDEVFWYLTKEKHKYKTVVIDTLSQAQDMSVRKIMEDKNGVFEQGSLGNWGTMTKQDWGVNATRMKTLVLQWRDLPMNVVFVAHDRVFGGEEDADENIIAPSVGPRLSPSVATVLNGAVSIIGSTFIRERVVKKKVGKGRKAKTTEKRTVEYGLRIGPHAYYTTKIRKPKDIGLPDVIVDPSYKKIMAIITGED